MSLEMKLLNLREEDAKDIEGLPKAIVVDMEVFPVNVVKKGTVKGCLQF